MKKLRVIIVIGEKNIEERDQGLNEFPKKHHPLLFRLLRGLIKHFFVLTKFDNEKKLKISCDKILKASLSFVKSKRSFKKDGGELQSNAFSLGIGNKLAVKVLKSSQNSFINLSNCMNTTFKKSVLKRHFNIVLYNLKSKNLLDK